LINTTDLSRLSLDEIAEGDSRYSVELPDAPELSHGLFQGDEFDPSEFLLARRHTGLEDLRSEVSHLVLISVQ
jgi:hypothetical protein